MNRTAIHERIEEGKVALRLARQADVPFMAAAIAYYAFVSLLPALLLAVSIGSLLGGEEITEQVLTASADVLTPAGQDALARAITGEGGRGEATVFGILLLVWSTTRVFRGLDKAFSKVYGTTTESGFANQVVNATTVLGSIGIAILGMIVLGGILATAVPDRGETVGFIGLLVGLVFVFFPLYYVFPESDIDISEAVPGTVVAAIGWVLLQGGFQIYTDVAPRYQLYGVIGGVLMLVTWFYLAAGLLLVGAVVNAVLAGVPNRQLQHDGQSE